MIYWLTDKWIVAYTYSTQTFLLIAIFSKTIRKQTKSFLNISNGLILVGIFMNLFLVVLSVIDCRATQLEMIQNTKVDGYDFYYSHNCFYPLLWTLFCGFIFHLCFFLKRFRTKIWTTITSILLLLVLTNLEKIIVFVTSLYRDYLPSSWSVYYDGSDKLWTILFAIIYFFVCWTISQVKFKHAHE